jgi:hypothetical protein
MVLTPNIARLTNSGQDPFFEEVIERLGGGKGNYYN